MGYTSKGELDLGTADMKQKARKQRVTWTMDELAQEKNWRSWFPKIDVVWDMGVAEIPDETAKILHDACVSFIESNCHIVTPGRGRTKFILRDAQKEVLWNWIKHRKNIALKSRQIGFSTLVAAYTLWLTWGWPDRYVILLSKGQREAASLLYKTKYAYKHLPEWVKVRGPKPLDRTREQLTFDNGSRIVSFPSASDPARGETAYLLVLDEWASLPNADEAWASLKPTVDIGGQFIGIGTARGEGSQFQKMWLGSQTGENGFKGLFFPWWVVEGRDQAWYDEQCREMEPWQVAQEFPSNPEEAFIGSGNPYYDLENLRRFRPETPLGTYTITCTSKKDVRLDQNGDFLIWETPNDADRFTYCVGADIAEGLEHGDYTVAWVLCVETGKPVAVWHGKVDPEIFGETILPAIGWYYRQALIAPEVNNHGLVVLKALQRVGYKRIYARRTLTKRSDRPLDTMGWLTTHTSKPLLTGELGGFLREVENMPHERTIQELRQFKRLPNGRTEGSPHDDLVMALGIAVQARKYCTQHRIGDPTPAHKVQGTMAWWMKQLDGGEKKKRGMRPSFSS